MTDEDESSAATGVQSAEVALRLLRMLAESGGEASLSALGAAAGMAPAKAHRYLVSLVRAGFVEAGARGGRYRLGAQALQVGLVALGRIDVMEQAGIALDELVEDSGENALLAVWSETGPTVVRWVDSSRPVTVNVRVGSHMPLLSSATGLVFGAWLPWAQVAPLVEAELQRQRGLAAPPGIPTTADDARALFASVRAAGLSAIDGWLLPGVQAFGAPVLDASDGLAAVMAVLGPAGSFDRSNDGPVAQALLRAARRLSERLGHREAGISRKHA